MFINWLAEPLQYEFMQRGMIAAVLVGIVCAVVGTYVVLRGMAFFGDALAHTILPGIAIGYLITGGARDTLFWWALGTAVIAALGIGAISKQAEIKEDTAIGIIFAGMFALGIALISTVRSYAVDLSHFLFGDVLGVSVHSLWLIIIFGGIVLLTIAAFYKEFLTLSFDPILAATLRLPVNLLNNLLLCNDRCDSCRLPSNGRCSLDGCHARHARRDGVFTDSTSANNDGAFRLLCSTIGCDRFVSFLLFKHRLRRGHSTNGHRVFRACILVETNEVCIMALLSSTNQS